MPRSRTAADEVHVMRLFVQGRRTTTEHTGWRRAATDETHRRGSAAHETGGRRTAADEAARESVVTHGVDDIL